MLDRVHGEHLERMRAAVLNAYSLRSAAGWICENTFLRGEAYSFLNHEYQETIVSDPSREKNIRKCSQVGLSEISSRLVLALVHILDSSTFIYTLPTAEFSKNFVKTRVDPTISASPLLKSTLNNTADNTQIKQFNSSFVYFKGTVGQNAAISVPADGLIHDEWDFSDLLVASNYESRLTHSPHKLKYKFSTPTVSGYGISAEMDVSRRFFNMAKCSHCNHWFIPSYFDHVHIPGFDRDKKEISRDMIHRLRWIEAKLLCPSCGQEPDLSPEFRAWACENPTENFEPAGYQISPFDAPAVITASSLVQASTKYDRFADFINFALGLPAEDKESSITRDDIERVKFRGAPEGFQQNVMGIDLGLLCHIAVNSVDATEHMSTVHTEVVPLARLKERRLELASQYRVGLTVADAAPYADVIMAMQAQDPNLYAAVYVRSKDLAIYTIKRTEERDKASDEDKKADAGELRERQVNVNRDRAFDAFMEAIRAGHWGIREDENYETVVKHMTDMKRIRKLLDNREFEYTWQKSDKGRDHFHHALLYAFVAGKMRGIASSTILLPGYMSRFKVRSAL